MPGCNNPIINPICKGVGGAVGGAVSSGFDDAAQKVAQGFGKSTALLLTFWTKVDLPGLSTSSGPVADVRSLTYWLVGVIAVGSLLVASIRLALTRNTPAGAQAARGLATMVIVTGAGVPAVSLLSAASDNFSSFILNRASGGDLGARLAIIGALSSVAGLGSALMLVFGLLGILAAGAQMLLMLVRVGVITILAGILPLPAAASITQGGSEWLKKITAWLLAFILYKPVAAIVYATAFYLVGDGKTEVSVLSGIFLMILAIVALPAMMRLAVPAVSAVAAAGSGAGGAAVLGGAVATGAQMLSSHTSGGGAGEPVGGDRAGLSKGPSGSRDSGARGGPGDPSDGAGKTGEGRPAGAGEPVGAGVGSSGGAAAGETSGGAATGGMRGSGAAQGGSGAGGSAGGPVGVAVAAGVQVAGAAKDAARGAAESSTGGS